MSPKLAGCSLILLAGLASVAAAQGEGKPLPAPQRGGELRARPFLMEPIVQREIGLTARQRESLANIEAEVQGLHQGVVAAPGDGEFDFHEMMSGVDQVARDRAAAVARVLTPAQKARLQQIDWQHDGWLILGRPEVAARLNLTRPQVERIDAALQAMQAAQLRANFPTPEPRPAAGARPPATATATATAGDGPVDAAGMPLPGGGPMNFGSTAFEARANQTGEAITRIQAESARAVALILSVDQRSALDRLFGPPFDFRTLDSPTPSLNPAGPKGRTPARKATKKG